MAAVQTGLVVSTVIATTSYANDATPNMSVTTQVQAVVPRVGNATAEPTVRNLGRSRPVSVRIPAIGVDSALIPLTLQVDGALGVPPNGFPAGWYTGGPTPGELGPSVIVGHVRWAGRPGVFYDLGRVQRGVRMMVERADDSTAVFQVTRAKSFPKDDFPTNAVYRDINHAGLRVITCGGLNPRTGNYDDNVVVFARLISARG